MSFAACAANTFHSTFHLAAFYSCGQHCTLFLRAQTHQLQLPTNLHLLHCLATTHITYLTYQQQKSLLPPWYLMVYLQRLWYPKARTRPTEESDSDHGANGPQRSVILLLGLEGRVHTATASLVQSSAEHTMALLLLDTLAYMIFLAKLLIYLLFLSHGSAQHTQILQF